MESLISFFCIVVLCMFVYGYIMMKNKYKNYSHTCNTLYIPRNNHPDKWMEKPHMEILDNEVNDIQLFNQSAPRGISEIENLIPSLNQRYDYIELREMGG